MARVSEKFVDETLWPEFQEISETLKAYLAEITERVVTQVIHQDSSEAEVVKEPALIGSGNVDTTASDAPSTKPSIAEQSDQKADESDKRSQGSRRKKKRQNRGKKKR